MASSTEVLTFLQGLRDPVTENLCQFYTANDGIITEFIADQQQEDCCINNRTTLDQDMFDSLTWFAYGLADFSKTQQRSRIMTLSDTS